MASPISVGDAVLLSKAAYRVAKAFTSGRKSAPAEFADIQKLLFNLGNALSVVAEDLPEIEQTADGDHANVVLAEIIANSRSILDHLQSIVDKYSEIEPTGAAATENAPDTGKTGARRWKQDFSKTWKKIIWTKEGGNLDKLKTTLDVHITGLNLTISALNKQQSGKVLNRVNSIDTKLDEIYAWFTANLQNQEAGARGPAGNAFRQGADPGRRATPALTFSVWTETADDDAAAAADRALCCGQASFAADWLDSLDEAKARRRVFQCHCDHACHLKDGPCTEPQIHHRKLDLFLTSVSLFVRLAGPDHEREWHIYLKSGTFTQPVSIVVNHVAPPIMADFEDHVDQLALSQASWHVAAGLNTMLVNVSQTHHDAHLSILNMKAATSAWSEDVKSATFTTDGRGFSPERIESVQVLHYRSMTARPRGGDLSDVDGLRLLLDRRFAEVVLQCRPSSHFGTEVVYSIRFDHNTKIATGDDAGHVQLADVVCVEAGDADADADDAKEIQCDQVQLRFGPGSSGHDALQALHAMQQELWISYLQHARWGERIVLARADIGDVHFPPFHLPAAHMTVVCDDPEASVDTQYRLILASCSRSQTVCVELSRDFLDRLAATKASSAADDEVEATVDPGQLRTWFVEVGRDGTHVFRRDTTVDLLLAHTSSIQQALLHDDDGLEAELQGSRSKMIASGVGDEDEAAADLVSGAGVRRLKLEDDAVYVRRPGRTE